MSRSLLLAGLSKRFGSQQAVERISLEVEPGECLGVLGPSGSGKSTLLRLVAGLEPLDEGTVSVDGLNVTGLPPERRGMAMVSQRPLLFPHLSVLDNAAFSASVAGAGRRESRASALPFLELVRLSGFERRRPDGLSGGQQQRVALARALAARPSVLLLDEPFSALDGELRSEMHELLRTVRDRLHPTVLLVTHDREEAASLADRIALVQDGRLVQHGTVAELYRRPASLAASRLMGGKNEISGRVVAGVHHSAWGAFPVRRPAADGRATVVVRQESVEVLQGPGNGVPATVTAVRPLGARNLVTVANGPALLHAETTGVHRLAAGDRVLVRIPADEIVLVR